MLYVLGFVAISEFSQIIYPRMDSCSSKYPAQAESDEKVSPSLTAQNVQELKAT